MFIKFLNVDLTFINATCFSNDRKTFAHSQLLFFDFFVLRIGKYFGGHLT